ncbi:MAG: multidrug ABC transporter [Clostridia bacterium]|nr:multidrug ABC transporter [Clostridia bacterium]
MSNALGIAIYLVTPLLSAVSQIMLKKSADNPQYTGIRFYLNPLVIFAYVLFFGCMLLNVVALRTLDLTLASVLEASGYLYVMVLGWRFLGEKMTARKLMGNALIVSGIVLTLIL